MRARSTAAASMGCGASGSRKGGAIGVSGAMGGGGSLGPLGGSIRGDWFIGGGDLGKGDVRCQLWGSICISDVLPEFDFGLPKYEHDREYCGIEKGELCIHLIAPVLRVCIDVEDAGRRFRGCAYEGPLACDYIKWVDKKWEGRARTVIMDLASKNLNLESRIKGCEREIEKNKLEKRANGRIHKDRMQFRDRIITFRALLYLGMFAIMFAVIVSNYKCWIISDAETTL